VSAGHTPGPWPFERTGDGKRYVVGEGLVEGPHGYEVAEVYSDDCDPDEALANARLIAAAPDMLAALKSADHALTQFVAFELDAREIMGNTNFEIVKCERERARAAIAKATGGQHD